MSKPLPWQEDTWRQLLSRSGTLPHALLLRGRSGTGKTIFARAFAQAMLCEALSAEYACGACNACNWFAQMNHPDFVQIEPEALSALAAEESERKKEPSKQIKIEQIRALQDLLSVGTHRGGRRVVIIRPAEAMNSATANALLKSLEEPPANTLFLLVASNAARLLPTIRSRCQAVDMPRPGSEAASRWLESQGNANADAALAHAGYAPLDVIEGDGSQIILQRLLGRLTQNDSDPLILADACAGGELPQVVNWMQKWTYDLAAVKLNEAPRYHPQAASALRKLSARMTWRPLLAYQRALAQARGIAQHPLNPRLFLEDLFMQYRALSQA
ncbi:MAG TPA: DNA polymerase III subunit delta' [Burkholderiales bacterium]|nr:DNA polymerase III subunit delta' [Burkholderiales bacterium]